MNWKQGLFGCFSNITLSVYTCCLFPMAIGKNAEAVGEANPVLWVLAASSAPCIAGKLLRGLIRKKKVLVLSSNERNAGTTLRINSKEL